MNKGFFDALEMLSTENGVSSNVLVEKVKSALSKAVKKAYPECERFRIEIDPATKTFEISVMKYIVDGEPIDNGEINIDEARLIDPTARMDDYIEVKLDVAQFGRAAALQAKQSIKGDLREISRENLLSQFQDKENECITAVVTQVEPGRGTVTIVHDKTELYLFRNEQIPGEKIQEGQTIKVYVTGIVNKQKKPIIKISRAHKDLVKRLFEMEIPEIYDGIVEVKSISREPGARTKIAVYSKDPNVDAVGACIGPNRSRISAIVSEISGEKIDIINYSEKQEEFIAKALAPAEVISVVIEDEEQRICTVTVPNNQLSLAIGNKGQNAKLAAKLTGYKIDIKPQYEKEQSAPSDDNDKNESPEEL